MKIRIMMKDPDGVYDSLEQFTKENPEIDHDEAYEMIESFFKWGEYVTIEVDTDTNTARVVGTNEAEF